MKRGISCQIHSTPKKGGAGDISGGRKLRWVDPLSSYKGLLGGPATTLIKSPLSAAVESSQRKRESPHSDGIIERGAQTTSRPRSSIAPG